MKTAFTAGTKVCPKGNQRGERGVIVKYDGEGFYIVDIVATDTRGPYIHGEAVRKVLIDGVARRMIVHEDDIEVWEGPKPFWRGGKDA